MTTKVCSVCETSKAQDEFPKKGAQCKACIAKKAKAAYQAKAAGGGRAVKTKKAKAATKANGKHVELVVDACFGFEASITQEGFLQVQQRNAEGEVSDTLVVSRTEFRQLVDKFSGWAAA